MDCFSCCTKNVISVGKSHSIIAGMGWHHAAKAGNEEILKKYLMFGHDVNCTDSHKRTALHYAYKSRPCYELLLAHGALINALDKDQLDPLCFGLSIEVSREAQCKELIPDFIEAFLAAGAMLDRTKRKTCPHRVIFSKMVEGDKSRAILCHLLRQGSVFNDEDIEQSKILSNEIMRDTFLSYITVYNLQITIKKPSIFDPTWILKCHQESYSEKLRRKCNREILYMRNAVIPGTKVTLFELLTKRNIHRYDNKKNIIDFFANEKRHNRFWSLFPLYKKELEQVIADDKRRQTYVPKASKALGRIFKINPNSFPHIVDNILKTLDNKDLINLGRI